MWIKFGNVRVNLNNVSQYANYSSMTAPYYYVRVTYVDQRIVNLPGLIADFDALVVTATGKAITGA
jgi:hypothetical protein